MGAAAGGTAAAAVAAAVAAPLGPAPLPCSNLSRIFIFGSNGGATTALLLSEGSAGGGNAGGGRITDGGLGVDGVDGVPLAWPLCGFFLLLGVTGFFGPAWASNTASTQGMACASRMVMRADVSLHSMRGSSSRKQASTDPSSG